ncbi:hypothetical protein K505DRAFT_364973 [Melanomma pulvis-pyrius CBS 109.77]|uniref:Uncharacterized protein n=1 Tax=Melanomma pulvis-pyrius CBS 109.77 TaxID=1314802 RepID=A0A6A6X0Z6_9PLEO|nr:hypothetical protein K505DRAFT_364973 [Melanomma pulvis-pyrius CBS 109.77]
MLARTFLIVSSFALCIVAAPIPVTSPGTLGTSAVIENKLEIARGEESKVRRQDLLPESVSYSDDTVPVEYPSF